LSSASVERLSREKLKFSSIGTLIFVGNKNQNLAPRNVDIRRKIIIKNPAP